ncbi:sel1 repeat family protein [Actinomadura sp. GC306]|uniref:sel1 repeat family protein n=1 Tax=Actinomadura sp. GC306 TaxID=2530367 RepID=UPI0010492995|nr:sel1 repeat family protein [Actinomadura sp. GC306]TDC68235.1 sel1 repeat family protein [Actinomadura sp. GC306]
MTDESLSGAAPLDEFIDRLVRLREECGSPSLRDLATSSTQVMARYKQEHPKLRALTVTALSDHLGRRRMRLPAWGWVATYVLACQDYARRSGACLDDPGTASLPDWHEHYRAARVGSTPSPPPLSAPVPEPAALAATGHGAEETPRDRCGTWSSSGGWPAGDRATPPAGAGTANSADPDVLGHDVLLDDAELRQWLESLPPPEPPLVSRYRTMFGSHGVDLLQAAKGGDLDAACRLGVLLLCENLPDEALPWLRSAAEGGDVVAKVLVHAESDMRTAMAAECAYELTLPGYDLGPRTPGTAAGSRTGAETYYRSASHSDHPGATYRLALMFQARGDDATAADLFARAAGLGHPEARDHLGQPAGRAGRTSRPSPND